MRQRLCRMCRQWHDLEQWPLECTQAPPQARSTTIPVPMFISDTMDAVEHPCNGQHYSSKSQFRRVTRESGCVEVGNDTARFHKPEKPQVDRASVKASLEKATARVSRGERISH